MTTHFDKPRCSWCPPDKPMYIDYHDHKWEVPVHDDRHLFEMLCLEGAQAGLSWYTILQCRNDDCKAFKNFDSSTCIKLTDAQLEKILANDRIIRNRVKVWSVRKNAQVSLKIQKGFGSFDAYLWCSVGGKPKVTFPCKHTTTTAESDAISKDLKKRGMSFVGSIIIYTYMQVIGLVNYNITGCSLALRARS